MDAGLPSTVTPGRAYPLGAHWDGFGVNFALVAPDAEAVALCLFDSAGRERRVALPACSDGVWHGRLAGLAPGQLYGYRVSGPYAPQRGQRYNPAKLLLDPYAREVAGSYGGQSEFAGHRADDPSLPDPTDNAAVAPKAVVSAASYDWGDERAPQHAWADTILYEAHVKGLSRLHPEVPAALRGSYAGLAHPAMLDHLQALGVTALSLLPLHYRADEARLQALGLSNYWGYATLGFFAPEPRYWSGRPGSTPLSELRDTVKALHGRGIEAILDVVYNHTAETDELGPTLSLRGIDNGLYYALNADHRALYENPTGCGNSLNLDQPRVLQLVMDSLRYWVEEVHVDGFRFDLAPVLGRGPRGFSAQAPFFAALRQDPVLARVKWIAEPWDLGADGYRLGQFPPGWAEWNDQYRDSMRGFWLTREVSLGQFARRFAASSDLFQHDGRAPAASINFITAHDGFSLRDLLSYDAKHNEANGEQSRDGQAHNRSWNCGAEGPSTDPAVLLLRERLQRALLATLVFSQGTPMLLAGDELGHTQQGNNNAYCQDNEISWLDWEHAQPGLAAYVGRLIALRKRYAALRRAHWFSGQTESDGQPDIAWLGRDAQPLTPDDWHDTGPCIAIRLGGLPACLLLLNAGAGEADFVLAPGRWRAVLDSGAPDAPPRALEGEARIPARALVLAVECGAGDPIDSAAERL